MNWVYNDGGRSKYFKADNVGDCAVRSIAIATGKDYLEVYNALKELNGGKSCRNGTPKKVDKKYLLDNGWTWIPTMTIGSGCKTHLCAEELPKGTLIVAVSKHLTCVIDGVIYDTFDPSRNGTRCVYGYYIKNESVKEEEVRKNKMRQDKYGIDLKVTLNDGREYIVEHYTSIYFDDGMVIIIGEYKYEFKADEIFTITVDAVWERRTDDKGKQI